VSNLVKKPSSMSNTTTILQCINKFTLLYVLVLLKCDHIKRLIALTSDNFNQLNLYIEIQKFLTYMGWFESVFDLEVHLKIIHGMFQTPQLFSQILQFASFRCGIIWKYFLSYIKFSFNMQSNSDKTIK
jgi:hypothetical protein